MNQSFIPLLVTAVSQGNAQAQCDLGLKYYQGQGVTQDYAEAVQWFRKAAEQGNAEAQCNLGAMYCQGQSMLRDDAEAVQ